MGSITQGMGTAGSVMWAIVVWFLALSFALPLRSQETYEDLERELNLDAQQKIKVEQIRRRYLDEILTTREEILKKRFELLNETRSNRPDHQKISKIRKDLEELRARREILFEKYRDEVQAILNSDQRRKFDDFCKRERRRLKRPVD
ncbi:MAG: hypothetical protein N2513_00650 [Deltaproteobacteria bacterium]|nr:hypothetical protein [Deltaproteobacteria bacterium]